ncbi:MAG: N-acetylmuramoyl-L-alanine amidase [Micromonosporaceae bacterium]|nr:N-acetylmuramoyl-L-alanine amidase [Micromonosporaceae bacterium]
MLSFRFRRTALPGRARRARVVQAVAALSVGWLLLGAAAVSAAPAAPAAAAAADRQQTYVDAATAYGVPVSVLLGVSYLESQWNTNNGLPSTSAGFGPMHLTDAAYVATLPAAGPTAGVADLRGDDARPPVPQRQPAPAPVPSDPAAQTVQAAAALTGDDPAALRTDPTANIRGGAALLARYQSQLGLPATADPAGWYAAVARYAGASDADTAAAFADEVYATIAAGADRITDDGSLVTLSATASAAAPDRSQLSRLGLPTRPHSDQVECPPDLPCEWLPAPYQQYGASPGAYGNHDLSDRPHNQKIDYIVIHDTEGSWDTTLQLVQDPTYLGWHYTIRSADGKVDQHIQTKDIGWHAGNWDINARSIGIEHEGYGAAQGAWYTEALYQASAKLVRYLATRFGIPLDRQHILGHDNVPGITPPNVAGMHWDPGPYWDWAHYFDLLKAPFHHTATAHSGLVTIDPDYATNMPAFTGCTGSATNPCPLHGSSAVILHTAPSATAPLVTDLGLHPDGSPSTMYISDHGARAATGQVYALAGIQGDWTAIWYLGQKAWFYNPASAPTALWSTGFVAVPKAGRSSIPVYGRAYPEAAAYPAGVPFQGIVPLQYTFPAGQRYAVGGTYTGQYYRAVTFDGSSPGDWTVISGNMRYVQVQFGHRIMFLNLDDVDIVPANIGSPV